MSVAYVYEKTHDTNKVPDTSVMRASSLATRTVCGNIVPLRKKQLQFAKEWSQRGEPALAILAFEKSLKAFELENEVT